MSSFDMGYENRYTSFPVKERFIFYEEDIWEQNPVCDFFFFIFASVQCSQHIAKLHCFAYTNRKEVFSKRACSFYVAG